MTISLRHSEEASDLVKQAVPETTENEIDLECFNKAMSEHKQNQKTYSLEDVEKELGL